LRTLSRAQKNTKTAAAMGTATTTGAGRFI
jgi:hypothetical protein